MKIAICDDEKIFVGNMEGLLEKISVCDDEVDVYYSGEALIDAYKNKKIFYDVVFLDMELGDMDGITVANAIRKEDCNAIIVFVTSYRKYMLKSFECQPFSFIVKPIKLSKLKEIYDKIYIKLQDEPRAIVFKEKSGNLRLMCDDILYFESQGHYVSICTRTDEVYKVRNTIKNILEFTDKNKFVKVHRSYVVNLKYVQKTSDEGVVMHYSNQKIPLSSTCRANFDKLFFGYKERKYVL